MGEFANHAWPFHDFYSLSRCLRSLRADCAVCGDPIVGHPSIGCGIIHSTYRLSVWRHACPSCMSRFIQCGSLPPLRCSMAMTRPSTSCAESFRPRGPR
ncbi:hypothetical protein NSERUTF1_1346 [Nocardia seriolae]|nr:hypothetical protein NSERUTF1_1346 [Nocardia seriolae]